MSKTATDIEKAAWDSTGHLTHPDEIDAHYYGFLAGAESEEAKNKWRTGYVRKDIIKSLLDKNLPNLRDILLKLLDNE